MIRRLLPTAAMFAAAAAVLAASPALAHTGHGEANSFIAGFTHPIFGPDHIIAMVTVGLWASTIGGRAFWAVPAAFVGTMIVGYALAVAGVSLPLVEPMILASVVVLGLLVALAVRLPVAVGAAIVAVFALFHGFAHGTEAGGAAAVEFGVGFALATALLHGVGILIGLAVYRIGSDAWVSRGLGAAAAVAGIALIAG